MGKQTDMAENISFRQTTQVDGNNLGSSCIEQHFRICQNAIIDLQSEKYSTATGFPTWLSIVICGFVATIYTAIVSMSYLMSSEKEIKKSLGIKLKKYSLHNFWTEHVQG